MTYRLARSAAVAAACAAWAGAAPAQADVREHLNVGADGRCPTYSGLEICSGEVPSFDGSRIDVDVTVPKGPRPPRGYPLVVMVHGAAGVDGSKREFESVTDEANGGDRYRWNTNWFARHGFYVLTFSQRGYRTDPPVAAHQPPTPSGTSAELPNGTIHLTSREFSIEDTEWLAAQVTAGFDIDRKQVVVTGRASGAGEAWLLAAERQWRRPHRRDRSLPVLHLRASLPRMGWTDLLYSMAPNGRVGDPDSGDDGIPSGGDPRSEEGLGGPFGSMKLSYLTAISALVSRYGVFEMGTTVTPSEEGPVNVAAWFARGATSDPWTDPLAAQIRRGLTEYRSAYYQEERWDEQREGRKVPIFSIQGWNDHLFTAVESIRQYDYLKRFDRTWPVTITLADVGNPNARNHPPVWRALNQRSWKWLRRVLRSRPTAPRPRMPAVTSYPTDCDPGPRVPTPLTASSYGRLALGELSVTYREGVLLTSGSGVADPNGLASDPLASDPMGAASSSGRCLASPGPATGAYTAVSEPLPGAATYVGLGHVHASYRLTGPRASVNARVWDVPPAGASSRPVLITRGTYTLDTTTGDPVMGTMRIPLFGNHWRLAPGHRLRLDLVQVDEPYLRRVNQPSTVRVGEPALSLPTRKAGRTQITGSTAEERR